MYQRIWPRIISRPIKELVPPVRFPGERFVIARELVTGRRRRLVGGSVRVVWLGDAPEQFDALTVGQRRNQRHYVIGSQQTRRPFKFYQSRERSDGASLSDRACRPKYARREFTQRLLSAWSSPAIAQFESSMPAVRVVFIGKIGENRAPQPRQLISPGPRRAFQGLQSGWS